MKTIGFVDYYISEWHANHYPAWIREASEALGLDFCVKYAWAEEYVSPVDGKNTDEWCSAFGIEKCHSLSELCEKSDCLLVLAPSNPEKHLAYAKEVLKYNKPTYIDKTFAPDYASAKEIFAIAEQHSAKFFSSSALRYAAELSELEDIRQLLITGGGSNFEEYIVHQLEMLVRLIPSGAKAVKVIRQGNQQICQVAFEGGQKAVLLFAPAMPYTVCAESGTSVSTYKEIKSAFFKGLIQSILHFYQSGELPFDSRQTLQVMKLRDGLMQGLNQPETWIELQEKCL